METGVEGAGRGTGRPCRHGRASQHGLRSIIWDLCSRDAKVLGWVCHPGPTSVERARRVLRSRDRVPGTVDRVLDRRITAASRGRSGGFDMGPR